MNKLKGIITEGTIQDFEWYKEYEHRLGKGLETPPDLRSTRQRLRRLRSKGDRKTRQLLLTVASTHPLTTCPCACVLAQEFLTVQYGSPVSVPSLVPYPTSSTA